MGGSQLLQQVHKVPVTDMEALKSPLMGLFEKHRACKFILYVQDYSETDPKTHERMDLTRVTSRDFILCLTSLQGTQYPLRSCVSCLKGEEKCLLPNTY
ncbi:hypothetical protein C1H46_009227 [Malus baccata]|uniref:Uncharacterized protein n=1 Tax=Malus baccata TaxID=106549 RepID=A0A540N222_MALBA|nr:hypothetical protein C1H46_009227 [Malus baccata]